MEISLGVFAVLFILAFFGFSIYSMVVFLKLSPKLLQILNDTTKHWGLKFVIYYGISFSIFLVATVFISFVLMLATFFLKGF